MTGPNPTDRGKLGTKRHVLTDGKGIPLSVVITAANTHDMNNGSFHKIQGTYNVIHYASFIVTAAADDKYS
jgi:DDE family transposase